jgi:LEA14-like dessication related protein
VKPQLKKILKRTAVGLVGGYSAAYLATALSAPKLVPKVVPKVKEISLQKIDFALAITVQNPTPIPFSFGTPFIQVFMNDKVILQSEPSVKRTWIPARGQGQLQDIPLEMTVTEGIALGTEILKSVLSGLGSTPMLTVRIETKVWMRGLGICPVWKTIVTELPINLFNKK